MEVTAAPPTPRPLISSTPTSHRTLQPTGSHTMKRTLTALIATTPLVAASLAGAGDIYFLGAVQYSYCTGVSADGSVVSGYDRGSAWYWTKDSWVVRLTESLPPGNGVGGNASIVDNGNFMTCSTKVGPDPDTAKAEATLFNIPNATYDPAVGSLGFNCDIERSNPWDMTPSGSHICGLIWNSGCSASGYVWSAATDAIKLMPPKYFFKPTRANAISADGNVVAGWNDDYVGWRQACMWTRDPATGNYAAKLLTYSATTTDKLPEATAISRDGAWVAGISLDGLNSNSPWRWSAATGYQSLGVPPLAGDAGATAVNADGTKILCYLVFAGVFGEGYIWIQGRGYVALEAYAAEFGVIIAPEWHLALPMAMSADGRTIVGAARRDDGVFSPFVLDLRSGEPCVGDLNSDGAVNGADLGTLLGDWGQDTASDMNGDNVVNGADLGTLLGAWGNCP
jgi:uncharacterized membrane protein